MSDKKQALIVFAKVPEPNKVKTRLTVLLSPEEAARLYEAFLKDAIDFYQTLGVDVRLYFGPSDLEIPAALQPPGITIHEQKGAGLGARMANAFAETFVAGYAQAVIIGTDHPTLPAAFIAQAYGVLDGANALSIGPSEDGGYYLLGMNTFYPQLFHDMSYSHEKVFEQTLDRADETQAAIHILPVWYDVDDPDTLRRLFGDVKISDLPLLRTREVLAGLEQSYPALQ
ncbi:MAG: TIGR04282 family arsenosugar biosynthesis glycosyltransferase [Rhodothermales bacterium]